MPQSHETKIDATNRRNKKKYKQIMLNVRRDSELCRRLEDFAENGNTSVTFLITKALCIFLECEMPHREYNTYTRIPLLTDGELEAWNIKYLPKELKP